MEKNFENQYKTLGIILIILGVSGFVFAIIFGNRLIEDARSALPALSFLILMIGFALLFPSLLAETDHRLSTMRIVVFAVTMVFCVTYIRLAWNLTSVKMLVIDEKWVYIIGLALGGKVIQKFGEEEADENPKAQGDGEEGEKKGEKKKDES